MCLRLGVFPILDASPRHHQRWSLPNRGLLPRLGVGVVQHLDQAVLELEALAQVFYLGALSGEPVVLSDDEIMRTVERFKCYGTREKT